MPRRQLVTPPSECRWIAVLECKIGLTDPVTGYWLPFNPKIVSLQVYPKVIPYTKFEIVRFWVMLRTDRQTDGLDILGVDNNWQSDAKATNKWTTVGRPTCFLSERVGGRVHLGLLYAMSNARWQTFSTEVDGDVIATCVRWTNRLQHSIHTFNIRPVWYDIAYSSQSCRRFSIFSNLLQLQLAVDRGVYPFRFMDQIPPSSNPLLPPPLKRSSVDHTVVTLQTHHTCLHLVSVHQTAPPLTSNSSHLIAAYYILIYRPQEDERLSWPS